MRRTPLAALALALAPLTLAALAPSAAAAGVGGPAVGVLNVQQISRDSAPVVRASQADTQVEPDIAADPNDDRIVVATYQQGRFTFGASVDPGYAWSHDGGVHWRHANLPKLTTAVGGAYRRASDPAVAFGPRGEVYITTLVVSFDVGLSGVVVQRSDDHGVTFTPPLVVRVDRDPKIFHDKNWITVDTSRGSPHYGRVYVMWDRLSARSHGEPQVVSWSDDGGRHWSGVVNATREASITIGAQPVVQPGGALTDVYYDIVDNKVTIKATTSRDGGHSWSSPVLVGGVHFAGPPDVRSGDLPAAVADPRTGRIHVVWGDGRFRGDGLADVVISSSSDGRHWSGPRRVNPRTAAELFTPDVAAYAGRVYVSWRSRTPADSHLIGFAIAKGDGRSFGTPLALGPPSDLRYAARGPVPFPGDYQGTWAGPHHVYADWEVASPPPGGSRFHQVTWGAALAP